MQQFNCNGIWWIPDQPEQKVAGSCAYSEKEGATLSLSGTLGRANLDLDGKTIPIILGNSWDCPLGTIVTLKDCRQKGLSVSSAGINREEYYCERVFVGAHLERTEDFQFSSLELDVDGLQHWAESFSGFGSVSLISKHGGFEVNWASPEPIRATLQEADLLIAAAASGNATRRVRTISERVKFNISCRRPTSEIELNERFVFPLQNLITFATNHSSALVEVSVRRSGDRQRISVLGAPVFTGSTKKSLLPHEMLFTLADVRALISDLLPRWLTLCDRYSAALSPFFSVYYQPESFVDVKFIVVFQSLEVYQRIKSGQASSALSSMLNELMAEHWEVIGPVFGTAIEGAVEETIAFRNFVVHRNSQLGELPDYGNRLFWLAQRLMFLMKTALLMEIGISKDERKRLLERNKMYAHLLSISNSSS